jgi:hypothetical protein
LHPHNVTLPTAILPPDLATVLMTDVATKAVHPLTRVSFMTGDYGAVDKLVLIPTEAAMTAIITTAFLTSPIKALRRRWGLFLAALLELEVLG